VGRFTRRSTSKLKTPLRWRRFFGAQRYAPGGHCELDDVASEGVTGKTQPASLLTPVWVSGANMATTVIKDKFISLQHFAQRSGNSICSAYRSRRN